MLAATKAKCCDCHVWLGTKLHEIVWDAPWAPEQSGTRRQIGGGLAQGFDGGVSLAVDLEEARNALPAFKEFVRASHTVVRCLDW